MPSPVPVEAPTPDPVGALRKAAGRIREDAEPAPVPPEEAAAWRSVADLMERQAAELEAGIHRIMAGHRD